jgi:hypothetical protein
MADYQGPVKSKQRKRALNSLGAAITGGPLLKNTKTNPIRHYNHQCGMKIDPVILERYNGINISSLIYNRP